MALIDTELAAVDAAERRALFQSVWRVCRASHDFSERELTEACYYALEAGTALDREATRRAPLVTEDEYVARLAIRLQNMLTLELELPRPLALAVLARVADRLTPAPD